MPDVCMIRGNHSISSLKMGTFSIFTGRLNATTRSATTGAPYSMLAYILLLLILFTTSSTAVLISNFENCLSTGYKATKALQFTPEFVDVVFNTTDPAHNLRVTIWGNVSGSVYAVDLPPPSSSLWSDATFTDGKIVNYTASTNKLTTLSSKLAFLSYEPYSSAYAFCDELRSNKTCPLAPAFKGNASQPSTYPSFQFNSNLGASYAFTSLTATALIINGDSAATNLGCISAPITPDLGGGLSNVLTYIPLVVLVSVAVATAFAGILSPWGTTDVFKWTSNYGRDADLLRLVTPGFGDCLQYIQFVVLTGGLTLTYPGYYQPVVSKVAWSALMFNQSFVSEADGYQSLIDGIYVTNGQYGLNDLSQLVGLADVDDIWAGMVVWLMVILAALLTIIQFGFLIRFVYRQLSNTREEDLRAKNMPFSVGNVIRVVFSYFLLPIVALSMFQLVEAGHSPIYVVVLAAILLVIIIVFAAWLLWVIASTRPRSYLFDDLPTVLLYGPLYNTYSDNAASFALIPVTLTFVRGIAIGALTPSGIAQLVVLAICEVITILTLHAFRPFHSPTSMNAYHTVFAAARFVSVLLMVAFAPSLGVTDGPKGWIGYAILLMHAGVLVFGFMLNALQTIVEVGARLAGAGDDDKGAARGGLVKVFGMRQLSRRLPRGNQSVTSNRQSQLSTTPMLDAEAKQAYLNGNGQAYLNSNGRARSQSASSAGILLNRPYSMGFDSVDMRNGGVTPTTPGDASMFSFLPAEPAATSSKKGLFTLSNNIEVTADPYYRPPRTRRPTDPSMLSRSPETKRASWVSGGWGSKRQSHLDLGTLAPEPASRETTQGPGQIHDLNTSDNRRSQTDYTTREVDFYYGVRGPALNANVPGRKLRTGPVDPTNSIASLGGFFKNLMGGKTKEKGKGFEVVRSSRMPPGMKIQSLAGHESPPEGIPVASSGVARNGPIDSDDEDGITSPPIIHIHSKPVPILSSPKPPSRPSTTETYGTHLSERHRRLSTSSTSSNSSTVDEFEMTRISEMPPTLPDLETGGFALNMPSRVGSRVSHQPSRKASGPRVPRKSSKRLSQNVSLTPSEAQKMMQGPGYSMQESEVTEELPSPVSPVGRLDDPISYDTYTKTSYKNAILYQPSHEPSHGYNASPDSNHRLPFERSGSNHTQNTRSNRVSTISTRSSIMPPRSSNEDDEGYTVAERTTGHVHQRSVQTVYPAINGRNVDLLGSQAEIVDYGHTEDQTPFVPHDFGTSYALPKP